MSTGGEPFYVQTYIQFQFAYTLAVAKRPCKTTYSTTFFRCYSKLAGRCRICLLESLLIIPQLTRLSCCQFFIYKKTIYLRSKEYEKHHYYQQSSRRYCNGICARPARIPTPNRIRWRIVRLHRRRPARCHPKRQANCATSYYERRCSQVSPSERQPRRKLDAAEYQQVSSKKESGKLAPFSYSTLVLQTHGARRTQSPAHHTPSA